MARPLRLEFRGALYHVTSRGDGPEVAAIVKKILRVYKQDAHDWERMGEWVERIGWPRFFDLTELPFTKYHLDNWRGARHSLNASAHIRF